MFARDPQVDPIAEVGDSDVLAEVVVGSIALAVEAAIMAIFLLGAIFGGPPGVLLFLASIVSALGISITRWHGLTYSLSVFTLVLVAAWIARVVWEPMFVFYIFLLAAPATAAVYTVIALLLPHVLNRNDMKRLARQSRRQPAPG